LLFHWTEKNEIFLFSIEPPISIFQKIPRLENQGCEFYLIKFRNGLRLINCNNQSFEKKTLKRGFLNFCIISNLGSSTTSFAKSVFFWSSDERWYIFLHSLKAQASFKKFWNCNLSTNLVKKTLYKFKAFYFNYLYFRPPEWIFFFIAWDKFVSGNKANFTWKEMKFSKEMQPLLRTLPQEQMSDLDVWYFWRGWLNLVVSFSVLLL